MRFDRSWLPGIVALIVLLLIRREVARTPLELQLALAALMGAWLLWTAWNIWRNPTRAAEFGSGGKRVQYWRGQRIELAPPPRTARRSAPPTTQLLIVLFYAALGAMVLAVAALGMVNRLG
jgi:hypothetical protein